jgi:nitroreductase
MIDLRADITRAIVAEARLAPSVHNVQPARFRFERGRVLLFADKRRTIPVADPEGRDWRISLGSAYEGLVIALQRRGLLLVDGSPEVPLNQTAKPSNALELVATASLAEGGNATAHDHVFTRTSWRGTFAPLNPDIDVALDRLAAKQDDLALVRDTNHIRELAALADEAGYHFLQDDAHRSELLGWMRLRRSHPDFSRDGLGFDAMQLGAIEAKAAGLVLGPLFPLLNQAGLARLLTNEDTKAKTASAFALFHRPVGENAFETGRAFYRAWLAMEEFGLQGCPVSVLADWAQSRDALHSRFNIAGTDTLISVFRIGKPKGAIRKEHARLPVDELLV